MHRQKESSLKQSRRERDIFSEAQKVLKLYAAVIKEYAVLESDENVDVALGEY